MKTYIIIFALLCGGAWAEEKMAADVMLAKEPPKVTFADSAILTAPSSIFAATTMNVTFCGGTGGAWLTVKPDRAASSAENAYAPDKTELLVSGYRPLVERASNGDYSITFKTEKPLTELEKQIGPSPSVEFVKAFELGVRYGLIAKVQKPDEDDIPTITKEAVKLYALIERGGYKKMLEEKPTEQRDLISLEQHERSVPAFLTATEARNGIKCPKCGDELWDDLTRTLTSHPPQIPISCKKCGYAGSRH